MYTYSCRDIHAVKLWYTLSQVVVYIYIVVYVSLCCVISWYAQTHVMV